MLHANHLQLLHRLVLRVLLLRQRQLVAARLRHRHAAADDCCHVAAEQLALQQLRARRQQ
jgi:hypothetical protein